MNLKSAKIIAVDFDGTLCENKWPVFILCERATSSTSGWNSANGLRHCRIRRLLLEKKLNFMLMERR